jgi:hypothetical protein
VTIAGKKPVGSRSILERLIDALAALQKKGLDIKIILGHHETVSQLEALQMFGNMDATEIRLQENVHNKGTIIDSSITDSRTRPPELPAKAA